MVVAIHRLDTFPQDDASKNVPLVFVVDAVPVPSRSACRLHVVRPGWRPFVPEAWQARCNKVVGSAWEHADKGFGTRRFAPSTMIGIFMPTMTLKSARWLKREALRRLSDRLDTRQPRRESGSRSRARIGARDTLPSASTPSQQPRTWPPVDFAAKETHSRAPGCCRNVCVANDLAQKTQASNHDIGRSNHSENRAFRRCRSRHVIQHGSPSGPQNRE